MDRFYYRQISDENMLPSVQQMGLRSNFTFMHDNDPKHASTLVKDWLSDNDIQVMHRSSSSSDLNRIEHLWDVLEDRVKNMFQRTRLN
jgi:transposase